MNIIFFGDVGDDNARCIFSRHLCFFSQEGNVTPLTPTHIYRKHHISTRFLIKIIFFHFPPKEKISYFLEKRNTIFPDITKKTTLKCEFLANTIFSEHLKKMCFQIFFWERSSFLLCLKNKITFSGKRNIIFPDNTRNIMFQWDLFKTFGKTKYGFSCSGHYLRLILGTYRVHYLHAMPFLNFFVAFLLPINFINLFAVYKAGSVIFELP